MLEWRNGASRLAMGVVVAALFAPMTAEATDYVVNPGAPDTTQKTLTTTDTLTVNSGGTLSTTGAVSVIWNGSSNTVINSGTIAATGARAVNSTGRPRHAPLRS
jgi:hypothetical protein